MKLRRSLGMAVALLFGACRSSDRGAASTGDTSHPAAPASAAVRVDESAFALADSSGTQLIVLDTLAHPARLTRAICSGGRVWPVAYVSRQPGVADSASRQTVYTFRYLKGELYRVSGLAPAGETCLVTADSALVGAATPAPAEPASAKCDSALVTSIAAARSRPVVGCWPVAASPQNGRIVATQFATRDTNALASVLLADQRRMVFHDFPGTAKHPGDDVWRADDGGVFSAEGMKVLFVARAGGVDVVALTWAASEGENAYLLAADSGSAFRTVAHAYRYWSPQ